VLQHPTQFKVFRGHLISFNNSKPLQTLDPQSINIPYYKSSSCNQLLIRKRQTSAACNTIYEYV